MDDMKIKDQQRYFDDLQKRSLESLIFMESKIESSADSEDKDDKLALIRVAIEGKRKIKKQLRI